MIRKIRALFALAIMAVVANAAAAAGAKMTIASNATLASMDALSRKPNVLADVLTVDRREYLVHLDGSGGGVLSGENLTLESVSGQAEAAPISIPFEQIALGYFREIPAGAKNKSLAVNIPAKETYPKVATVGNAEEGMGCAELDIEIARAGAIRWYARQQGAVPFTAHEALVQHEKNAGKDVGITVLVAVALIGASGGGGGAFFPGGGGSQGEGVITSETFRWAVTAADRRETGLLELKNKRSCPPVQSPDGASSDLEIFAKIDATRAALGAKSISDTEQRDQQTQLLDQLDPAQSATQRVARAFDFAEATTEANERRGEPLGGASLASYRRYVMVEAKGSACSYPKLGWPMTGRAMQMGGPFDVRERALTWTREDTEEAESLQFKDIEELRPTEHHYGIWYIPIRKADGSCLFLNVTNDLHRVVDAGQGLQDMVRSAMLARMSQVSQ